MYQAVVAVRALNSRFLARLNARCGLTTIAVVESFRPDASAITSSPQGSPNRSFASCTTDAIESSRCLRVFLNVLFSWSGAGLEAKYSVSFATAWAIRLIDSAHHMIRSKSPTMVLAVSVLSIPTVFKTAIISAAAPAGFRSAQSFGSVRGRRRTSLMASPGGKSEARAPLVCPIFCTSSRVSVAQRA